MKNEIKIEAKAASGYGDIAGTRISCSCGFSTTTSMASNVAGIAHQHQGWHDAKDRIRTYASRGIGRRVTIPVGA